ncbi:MAG: hypothetical protein V2J10_02380 [Wenzhouxiangella sp.]|nr:hypothetical protein [Wenzhouxiangella sp.]
MCSDSTPGLVSSAAVATGFGGAFPTVGSVSASASLQRGDVAGAASTTFGNGTVSYFFAIEQTAPPPFQPATIPVRFRASGELTVAGDTELAESSAGASIPGIPGADLEVALTGPGTLTFDDSVAASVATGTSYNVLVYAFCSLRLDDQNTAAGCDGWSDPAITFDQAAFDAMHQDAFPLDNFFQVSYSANVTFETVPLPFWYMLLSMATLVAVGCRRIEERGRTASPGR